MLPDSMNVGVIAENIKKLEAMVQEAGAELPTPEAGDAGKVLTVNNDLGYSIAAVPQEVPTPGAGDTGKILKVGSEGYELATDYATINYSTTEQDTGIKWIDEKTIYSKTVIIDSLPSATDSDLGIECDKIILTHGFIERTGVQSHAYVGFSDTCFVSSSAYAFTTKVGDNAAIYNTGLAGAKMTVTVYYTKLTQAPAPETETKKKTSKKGELKL